MFDVLLGTLGAILILWGLMVGVVAWRLVCVNPAHYQVARNLTKTMTRAATGGVPPIRGGVRDHRIAAGLSLTRDNEWRVEGRLSTETVRSLVGRKAVS